MVAGGGQSVVDFFYFGKEHLGLISLIVNNPHMQCMQRSLHNSQVTDFLNNIIIYIYICIYNSC